MLLSHLSPDPLQAPQDEIDKFHYIRNEKRQTYAAMVSRLDKSVGKVVEALDKRNMLENSVILFLSDNGAPVVGNELWKDFYSFDDAIHYSSFFSLF